MCFPHVTHKIPFCSAQWKNRVFLAGPSGNKPANLQTSSLDFSPIGFPGLINVTSSFAGFKKQTCKTHVLLFPFPWSRWFWFAGKKRLQPTPLLICQSSKLRRARKTEMAHLI
jgi:hypothetical protein